MTEIQHGQTPETARAWHILKSLTGKVVLKEPIVPGVSIPFSRDYFTQTNIELDTDGQLLAVRRIIGRNEEVDRRPVTKSLEKFNLFGQAPREEIIIENK